ncbi:GNAT family N-acetyltransferase [Azospirillum agricola]|uniref:GNAT family N-acetyltransferase n=1 Tax=Azospirillum agricola TaxID=1720247 RepID=UPI000A1CE2C8
MLELGYITVAQRQGQGVATECIGALVDHLFQNEGYRQLFAEIDAENAAFIVNGARAKHRHPERDIASKSVLCIAQ